MSLDRIRVVLEPAIRRVLHFYWRFARGMTFGVRGAVFDAQGRVFLIKHSYVSGWHMPGGGVEAGESAIDALRRELREEGNIEVLGTPPLFGLYFNASASKRDHVALYVVREYRQDSAPVPDREIVAHGFFAPGALPPDTSRGTRARLDEILNDRPPSAVW